MSKDIIEDLISHEQNSALSDKILNGVSSFFCVLSCVLFFFGLISFFISQTASSRYWIVMLFPILAISALSSLFALRQFIRRLFLSSLLTLIVNIILFIALIILIITASVIRGGFFPFYIL